MPTKVIGFLGVTKYDIVRGIAALLQGMGARILVVDMTALQFTIRSIPSVAHQGMVEFCEIHYGADPDEKMLNEWIKSGGYDYVLLDVDCNTDKLDTVSYCRIYYIVDFMKAHIDAVSAHIHMHNGEKITVVRDMVYSKNMETYMEKTLLSVGLLKEQLIMLHEQEVDRIWRLKIPYQYQIPFKSMSKQYKSLFYCLLSEITSISEKEYKNIFKQVERSQR